VHPRWCVLFRPRAEAPDKYCPVDASGSRAERGPTRIPCRCPARRTGQRRVVDQESSDAGMQHPGSTLSPMIWTHLAGTPFSQRWVDAGGVQTRALEVGDPLRPPLVLLHGIGGHAEAYARNLRSHAEWFHT